MGAKLPSPEDFGVNLPRASRSFVPIAPDQSGKVLQGFGAQITKMAEEEADRLDRINVQNALSELSEADTELAYGEDGFLRSKQNAVNNPNFMQGYQERFKQRVDGIAAKINRPKAREVFIGAAAGQTAQFNRGLLSHISRQVEEAQSVANQTSMKALYKKLDYEPSQIGGVMADARAVLMTERPRFGKGAEGDKLFTLYVEDVMGGLASKSVESALSKDSFELADQLLTEHGRLMGDDASKFRLKLKGQKAAVLGAQLGDAAVAMHKAGKPATEIVEYVSKRARAEDPANADRLVHSATASLDLFRKAEDDGHNNTADALYNKFTDGQKVLVSPDKIRSDPAFRALPEDKKARLGKLMDTLVDEVRTEARMAAQAHSGAARERLADIEARKRDDPAIMLEVENLLRDPDRLAAMSVVDITGLKSRIGTEYTRILVGARAGVLKDAKGYTLQQADLDEGLAAIKDKDARKRMSLQAHAAIERWKALPGNEGKIPDYATRRQIIANTAVRLTDEGTFSDDVMYAFRYQDTGRLKEVYMTTKGRNSAGVEEEVNLPGDYVAWVLKRYPHLTSPQMATMWFAQTPGERKRWGR